MNTVSAYLFRQAVGPLLAILGALAAIAILTQGLNQLDLIVSNRRAGLAFAWVTILALPQLISLILPMAVFIAVVYALNRMQNDSEIAVLYSTGLSRRQIARPVLQLATLAALVHLFIAVIVQPAASTERREVFFALRNDIASSLIEEGSFTFPADKLTLYARGRGGGRELRDLLINDARHTPDITYTARAGAVATIDVDGVRTPVIVMRNGQVQRQTETGSVDVLDFDRYVLQLGGAFEESDLFFLKAGDRTLHDLFFPDRTAHYDQRNIDKFLAEGHARLAAPLLNIALAAIALAGVLGGEFSRRGYARRIAYTAVTALVVRLLPLGVPGSAEDNPDLNILQYALPIAVVLICGAMLSGRRGRRPRLMQGPSVLAAEA